MTIETKSRTTHLVRRVLKWGAIVVPILIVVVYLSVGAVAADVLGVPKRQFTVQNAPAQFSLAFQDVRFPSRGDEVQIAGWYIPQEGSERAVILVHGKDASRTEEFNHTFVNLAATLEQGGFNVLMIDLRGHGQSGNARYSFGLNERRDVEGAVDWLAKQGFQPGTIGVLGVSLGAASVVGATAEEPSIGALVTDSSFAELCPVMQINWNQQTGLPDLILPSALLMNHVMFGYDLCDARPVNEIGRIAPRPILLIHSTDDQMVPVSNVYALKTAAPSAEMWIVTGPEHARIYNADPAAYSQKVIDFFDRSLKKGDGQAASLRGDGLR